MGQTIAQAFYEEGENEGEIKTLQRLILRQGRTRFGIPDETTERFIQGIDNTDQLEALTDRVMIASSWTDLLGSAPKSHE